MDRTQLIDWGSADSHVLLNPRLPEALKSKAQLTELPKLPAHVWLGSSGTTSTGSLTLYGLSKTGFMISAESANHHVQTNKDDIWLLTLPIFHVGGLSIHARAYIGGQKVIDRSLDSWGAEKFHAWVEESRATLVSLVPTQIFDLVKLNRRSPRSLRAIVVGGAALSESLYLQARELGFPCLPSFGATEAFSQIATAELSSLNGDAYPELRVLSHIEVSTTEENLLAIRSPALFTARVDIKPATTEVLWRAGDWYITKDFVELSFDENDPSHVWLTPKGRLGDFIKISGELVSMLDLTLAFSRVSGGGADFAILSAADTRRGSEVVLVLNLCHFNEAEKWVRDFNTQVLPVARVQSVYFVRQLPKSDLNKVLVGELKARLGLE